jgi:hypothetical protein
MIELFLVISLFANAFQYHQNEKIESEYKTIIEVSNINADIVESTATSLNECTAKLANWQNKEDAWNAAREANRLDREELESRINSSGWGDIRIPDSLEF